MVVLACAATVERFDTFAHWPLLLVAVGAGLFILVSTLLNPPALMWDGQLPDGTPTGGMEVGRPSIGFGLWLIGAAALVGAGICGLLTQTQSDRPAVQGPPAGGV
ncbi:hypothetical protein D3I60_09595 [Brevibacterium permense]|uniref:hypothetical protein n=1 Tax=Brevibacterium permense TaxID=234834 RepID=UPI0021D33D90|nr:hypothetical protein [Brevibacterium permense]MCU4297329.1 hypothetical protein [Brevibacterium permense]